MTIDYWWHAPACSLDTSHVEDTDLARRIRGGGNTTVGIGFKIIGGRLTGVACSVKSRGRGCGWQLRRISHHDAEVLTPLAARQALWEQAISQQISAGILSERDLRPCDARYLGAAPEEDHE